MASINKVHLIGNVGKDPELRYAANGKAVANCSIATSFKKKQGDEYVEITEWHRLAFFDRLAEIVGELVKKGTLIYVEGSIKYQKYVNKDGVEVSSTTINCSELTILKRSETKEKPVKYEGLPKDEEDDIPF